MLRPLFRRRRRRAAADSPVRAVRTHTTTPAFRAIAAERGFTPDTPPYDQDKAATTVAELAALARPIQRGDTDLEAGLHAAGITVHDSHPAASSVAGLASLRAGAAAQGTLRTVDNLAPVVLLENRRAEVERRRTVFDSALDAGHDEACATRQHMSATSQCTCGGAR